VVRLQMGKRLEAVALRAAMAELDADGSGEVETSGSGALSLCTT
jgi:hypothetical protein